MENRVRESFERRNPCWAENLDALLIPPRVSPSPSFFLPWGDMSLESFLSYPVALAAVLVSLVVLAGMGWFSSKSHFQVDGQVPRPDLQYGPLLIPLS